jgi:alcohol dehydrogenase (cytochrome c)
MTRGKWALAAAGAIIVAALGAAVAIDGVRYRLRVVAHKALGALPDVSWGDLAYMLDPRSRIWLEPLAADPNPYASLSAPVATQQDIDQGRTLFASRCATCHAQDASGATGPALVGRTLQSGDSDWALYRTIRHGIPRTAMLAQPLSRAETWQVIAHVRSLLRVEDLEPAGAAGRVGGRSYEEVTSERLNATNQTAGMDGWLTYSGSYNGQRFSSVSQINRTNVRMLRVSWLRPIDGVGLDAVQATPLVNGDVMFVTAPPQRVLAISARSGTPLWQYSRAVPEDLVRGYGTINRGVALWGRLVIVGTLDAHLIALDAETGQVRWDIEVAPYKQGYMITGAPLAINGLVVTGISGGDYPIRGFIDAYDAATGQRRWRFHTIPARGEPGSDTWPGDSWKVGGGGSWVTGSFDSRRNLILWGVGNPSPSFAADLRNGDNLYTSSVVALDASTGRLAWHFQFMPRDEYDWDAAQIPVLADLSKWGGMPDALLWANHNGFFYLLDGESGAFKSGTPFVRQNWARGLDERGRPIREPAASPSARGTLVYPQKQGGTSWWSPTFNPSTGLLYVPTHDGPTLFFRSGAPAPTVGEQYLGGSIQSVAGQPPVARVKAIQPLTGAIAWEYRPSREEFKPVMGLMSTGGELVFASHGTRLVALDAISGAELWQFDTGQPVKAAPISFLVDGRQHVAVVAGGLLLTFSLPPS